jgi:hypothetical protein
MTDHEESGPKEVSLPTHVVQAKEVVRQATRSAQPEQQIDLEHLVEVAEPLVKLYFDAAAAKQEREIAYDTKVLEYDGKRQRNLIVSFSFIIAGVLVFAGYLMTLGRDAVALDLIKLLASLGSVGFGGYGVAQMRRRREVDQNE